ncbi:MAG: hypothetical protein JXQ91_20380 [Vannielia sp.]|uniref:hypothetical protein n=1 Tax=Rhodobacterales TaxID=204455 RepID=UPI0020940DD8|nr:hypothetical protein [Oceanicola sp. 502str15]MCO6385078.1 hypothetical protein [Oceanicola sp. 502str15]
MARLSAAALSIALLASPVTACDISLPLSEGMFRDLDAPLDQLTGLPADAGAFEYLDEHYLDTIHLTHDGKTYPWTAKNTASTCARSGGAGRSCRMVVDTETRFGKITLTQEASGGRTQYRYRLLMVEGRRHVRLFPRPAVTRLAAACNLMKSVDSFRRTWMHR